MKKYSSNRFFLEYVSILFITYFICSAIGAFFCHSSYMEALTNIECHMVAFLFIYWWVPLFRMNDMEQHNRMIRLKERRESNNY